MIFLETERLLLRNTRPEDAKVMFDYRNNELCARYQRGQTIRVVPRANEMIRRRLGCRIRGMRHVRGRLREETGFAKRTVDLISADMLKTER